MIIFFYDDVRWECSKNDFNFQLKKEIAAFIQKHKIKNLQFDRDISPF
jgi:hypothetical protein